MTCTDSSSRSGRRRAPVRINLGSGARVIARNRCADCEHVWEDKPTGFAYYLTCPRCQSEYWEWLNHNETDD